MRGLTWSVVGSLSLLLVLANGDRARYWPPGDAEFPAAGQGDRHSAPAPGRETGFAGLQDGGQTQRQLAPGSDPQPRQPRTPAEPAWRQTALLSPTGRDLIAQMIAEQESHGEKGLKKQEGKLNGTGPMLAYLDVVVH